MNRPFNIGLLAAQGLVLCAVLAGLVPLFWFALSQGGFEFGSGVWSVLAFTLKQAAASTMLSVVPGFFVARAMARRQFYGRQLLLQIFAAPMAVPAIVAVLGLTALYGNHGVLSGWINLYGFGGIVLAHVFFNLPMATRLFLEVLEAIAPENFRLAAQLGFSDSEVLHRIELPYALRAGFRIATLIFMLCAASFVIVLTLGGASSTTLEVAIFQSLRMDFDVPRALALSILQIILSGGLVFIGGKAFLEQSTIGRLRKTAQRFDGVTTSAIVFDSSAIILSALLVIPPLIVICVQGFGQVLFNAALLSAFATSCAIGFCSAAIALGIGWHLSRGATTAHLLSVAALLVPPAVLATGWFLLLRNLDASYQLVFVTIVALNALMALPFVSAILSSALRRLDASHERLCQSLGLQGWNKFKRITLPIMLRPLGQAGLMAFVLSLGDLTAVTLLGSEGLMTLPSLIHAQMGHYRSNEAGGTALVLMALCFCCALVAQRIGGLNDQA